MNWLKLAFGAILIIGVIIAINFFRSSEPEPPQQTKPKTFQEQIAKDDRKLRAEPQVQEYAKPQFKELSEIEQVGAERLFEFAINQRKMARLPGVGYKAMVDTCRQIINKYPESVYAFKAKRMLNEVPEQLRARYKITDEEINLGNLE